MDCISWPPPNLPTRIFYQYQMWSDAKLWMFNPAVLSDRTVACWPRWSWWNSHRSHCVISMQIRLNMWRNDEMFNWYIWFKIVLTSQYLKILHWTKTTSLIVSDRLTTLVWLLNLDIHLILSPKTHLLLALTVTFTHWYLSGRIYLYFNAVRG